MSLFELGCETGTRARGRRARPTDNNLELIKIKDMKDELSKIDRAVPEAHTRLTEEPPPGPSSEVNLSIGGPSFWFTRASAVFVFARAESTNTYNTSSRVPSWRRPTRHQPTHGYLGWCLLQWSS